MIKMKMLIQSKLAEKIMSWVKIMILTTKKFKFNQLKLIKIKQTFKKMLDLLTLKINLKIIIKTNIKVKIFKILRIYKIHKLKILQVQ